jgi:hypothetical protein
MGKKFEGIFLIEEQRAVHILSILSFLWSEQVKGTQA